MKQKPYNNIRCRNNILQRERERESEREREREGGCIDGRTGGNKTSKRKEG